MNQPNNVTTSNTKTAPSRSYCPESETIYLYPAVRSFLLESICLRLDLKHFAQLCLKLTLQKSKAHELTGNCPYCHSSGSFHINKRNGESHCTTCGSKKDLFSLINELSKHPSTLINDALSWLKAYCQMQAEQQAASRATTGKERV